MMWKIFGPNVGTFISTNGLAVGLALIRNWHMWRRAYTFKNTRCEVEFGKYVALMWALSFLQ